MLRWLNHDPGPKTSCCCVRCPIVAQSRRQGLPAALGDDLRDKQGYVGGDEGDLDVLGTSLERFRVRTDSLTFVKRRPPAKSSNPFTTPEPVSDAGEMVDQRSAKEP
jgi:hypothetical protein